jgi:chemotaxis protein methyltransferase CheR
MNDEEYTYLKKKILKLLNIDLGGYKDHQMRRRLDAFISRTEAPGVAAYCKTLDGDRQVCQKLRDFLTINVSEFFRDKDQYEILRTRILPELMANGPRLSIWSAGCSIGAEPYSIAIMLEEMASYHRHRILASDLDTGILAKAKAGGPYLPADVKNVDKNLLAKHFKKVENDYWVTDRIRERVEFRQHNLLMDPFVKDFDLIVCRNVVIYFTDDAKRKLYRGFYESLKDNGVFFMGGTETMLGASDLKFEKICASFHRKCVDGGKVRPGAKRTPLEAKERGDRIASNSRQVR